MTSNVFGNLNSEGFDFSSYLPFIGSLFEAFGDRSKGNNYKWFNHHFHLPQHFLLSSQIRVFAYLFYFLPFSFRSARTVIRRSICITNFLRILFVLFSRTVSGLCIYHLFVWANCCVLAHFPVNPYLGPFELALALLLSQFSTSSHYVVYWFHEEILQTYKTIYRFVLVWHGLIYLFNGISAFYGIFNTETWIICKFLKT